MYGGDRDPAAGPTLHPLALPDHLNVRAESGPERRRCWRWDASTNTVGNCGGAAASGAGLARWIPRSRCAGRASCCSSSAVRGSTCCSGGPLLSGGIASGPPGSFVRDAPAQGHAWKGSGSASALLRLSSFPGEWHLGSQAGVWLQQRLIADDLRAGARWAHGAMVRRAQTEPGYSCRDTPCRPRPARRSRSGGIPEGTAEMRRRSGRWTRRRSASDGAHRMLRYITTRIALLADHPVDHQRPRLPAHDRAARRSHVRDRRLEATPEHREAPPKERMGLNTIRCRALRRLDVPRVAGRSRVQLGQVSEITIRASSSGASPRRWSWAS